MSPSTLVSIKNDNCFVLVAWVFYFLLIHLMSDECVFRSFYAVVYGKRSRVVQAKAGVDVISEVTVEGVQVLFQIYVKERQSPSVVVECHSNPYGVDSDPQVRTPAVVQKLVFMPNKKRSIIECQKAILFILLMIFLLCQPLGKQMLNNEPTAGFQMAAA